jgi:hypothetical protein
MPGTPTANTAEPVGGITPAARVLPRAAAPYTVFLSFSNVESLASGSQA